MTQGGDANKSGRWLEKLVERTFADEEETAETESTLNELYYMNESIDKVINFIEVYYT